MKLKTLQSEVQQAVRDDSDKIDEIVVSNKISAKDRIATYARSSFLKPYDVINDDFLVTEEFLGEEVFETLLTKFLKQHPADTHYINEAGREFPEFLRQQKNLRAPDFLYDLAMVEWLRVESFFNFFDYKKQEAEPSEDEKSIFKNPSIITFKSQWPLHEIWEEEVVKEKQESLIYIWTTEDRKVHVNAWYDLEAVVLKVLLESQSLEKAIEKLAEKFAANDLSVVFSQVLPQWVSLGLLEVQGT